MPLPLPTPQRSPDDDAGSERRARILDAAERCFVRAGFHRTTMQDVAVEAGMSPGNLYRSFSSKDAMVAGLAERDRADLARDFSGLEETDDFIASFAAIGRKHFEEEPRERAVLCLQIWAEANRDPAFATMSADFEAEVIGRMAALFRRAQERGALDPGLDPVPIARLVSTLANGLFVRRAIVPDFDARREVPAVLTLIGAMLTGAVRLPPEGSAPDPARPAPDASGARPPRSAPTETA